MKAFYLLFLLISSVAAGQSIKQDSSRVIKLADGFKFIEGPACDKDGNVYFTDIPNNQVLVWTIDHKLDTFRNNTGGANGLFFDGNGNLCACEGINRQVTVTDMKLNTTIICDTYNGKKLNQPNDLWLDPKGGIYFSDPFYTGDPKIMEQDGMCVYYISPDRKTVNRVINDYVKPNGIIGTPDGKFLYVTDASGGKTWKYKIRKDGSIYDKTLLADIGCDGMTLDKDGNVYLTSFKSTVDIYSPGGKLLQAIPFPEIPANVCFGGPDHDILFATSRTSLYCVKMNTKGFGKNMTEYNK